MKVAGCALLFSLLLCGCASGAYSRAQLHKDVAAGIGGTLRAEADTGNLSSAPPGINTSQPLTADQAVAVGLWNNALFRADLTKLELASADVAEARSLTDPALSVVFPGDSTDWSGTVSWPLQLLQMPWRIRTAKLDAQTTVQNLILRGLALERDTRTAHAAAVLARERAVLLREDAALASKVADIARLQFDAGRIGRSEVERLAVDSISAQSAQLNANQELASAENALLQLLGLADQPNSLQLQASDPALVLPPLENTLSMAMNARADLRAARALLDRAAANAGLQRAQLVSLTALLDLNKESGSSVDIGPGVAVTLPIFNANRGGRRRAGAELERATLGYAAVRQQISAEIRTEHAALAAAIETHRSIQATTLPAATAIAAQLDERLRSGRESAVSVMQARRTLLSARLAAEAAVGAVRRSAARLAYSAGTGSSHVQ